MLIVIIKNIILTMESLQNKKKDELKTIEKNSLCYKVEKKILLIPYYSHKFSVNE